MAKLIATDRMTNLADIEKTINHLLLHGSSAQSSPSDVINLLEKYDLLDPEDSPADQLWKAQLVIHLLKKGAQESSKALDLDLSMAGEENQSSCPFEAGNIIKAAIRKRNWQITKEAFLLLDATKQLLHPTALPAALDGLSSTYELWPSWERVCGKRALWLSPQRKQWSWWHHLHSDQGAAVDLIIWDSLHNNPIDASMHQTLKATDFRSYFKFLGLQPLLGNIELLNYIMSHSRSKALKQTALDHLLLLPTSEPRQAVDEFATAFCKSNLIVNSNRLILQDTVELPKSLSFDVESIGLYESRFANPIYRILSVPTFATLFGHLEIKIDGICQQLMTEESLERLGQAAIYSSSRTTLSPIHSGLVANWIDLYPDGNTVPLDMTPLFRRLNSNMVDSIFQQILADDQDDYTIERMSLVARDIQCYLSPSLSNKLCKYIVNLVNQGCSHTDKKNLKACLPNLANRLDPKSLLVLKKIWPDDALYYSDLSKPLISLRETLEARYELFLYISGSK